MNGLELRELWLTMSVILTKARSAVGEEARIFFQGTGSKT